MDAECANIKGSALAINSTCLATSEGDQKNFGHGPYWVLEYG